MADVRDVNEANRKAFSRAETVGDYAAMAGPTSAERTLFQAYVPRGSLVLDLGVGTGRTTEMLQALADRYVGVDYSEAMLARARLDHPDSEFALADASDLSLFDDASFDVVVFSYNGIDYLHPDDTRRRCLAEVARVLVPGGSFLCSVHNPRALLRPPQRPLSARSIAVAAYQTARRAAARLGTSAWRSGEGYVVDQVRGGLTTHMAVPARVIAETEQFGFRHRTTVASDHPAHPSSIRTPWWYYAFERGPDVTG